MLRSLRSFCSSATHKANYGFIGLGQMGQHMARHVYNKLDAGDKLYVYDSIPEATKEFVEKNIDEKKPGRLIALHSLPQFVTGVDSELDFIVTMVPEGKDVRCIVNQLVECYQKQLVLLSTTFLDSSTIDIGTSREIHDFVKKSLPSFDFIDTPVSGGVQGARNASLSFMLSRESPRDISPALNTLLEKMGKNIFPCGRNHGSGLAAKLSNNYLLAVTNLAVADSFQLAKTFGLNLKQYAKLVSVSTGKSWASVDNCPIADVYPECKLPADVGYEGGFITKLTKKDLVLATKCAQENDRFLFLGDISKKWYLKACEREDLARRDLAVLYEWLGELEKVNGKIFDKKTSEKFDM